MYMVSNMTMKISQVLFMCFT